MKRKLVVTLIVIGLLIMGIGYCVYNGYIWISTPDKKEYPVKEIKVVYEIGFFKSPLVVFAAIIFIIVCIAIILFRKAELNKGENDDLNLFKIYMVFIIGIIIIVIGAYKHYKLYNNYREHKYKIVEGYIHDYYKDVKDNESFHVEDKYFWVDDKYRIINIGNWHIADGKWARIYYDEDDDGCSTYIYKMEIREPN